MACNRNNNHAYFIACIIHGLIVGVMIWPSISNAAGVKNSLEKAFDALTSTTRPGVYHSQIRGYMTGGGFQVHFPSYAVDLISLSPPHYSAGCNGIDLYLGGLSYISGKQFVYLLRGIAANTMGYSFGLAMRTLCPVCATTVSQLQKVAQAANHFAINQCQVSMGLVNAVTSQQAGRHMASLAALEGARTGKTSDFLAGMSEIGDDVSKALNTLASSLSRLQDKGSQLQALQSTHLGSDTWKLLSGLNRTQKLFIQSVLGTTVRYPYPATHPKMIRVLPVAASMSIQQLVDLFMYGVEAKHPDNANIWVNDCSDDNAVAQSTINKLLAVNNQVLCQHVVKQRIKASSWYRQTNAATKGIALAREGFFGLTYALLSQAIANVSEGKPLGTPAVIQLPVAIYGGSNSTKREVSFTQKDIEGFISIAPLPLYRAINIAAVYPEISQALMANIAEIVAAQYATTYLEQILLNTREQGNHKGGLVGLSPDKVAQLTHALGTLRQRLHQHITHLVSHRQVAEMWTKQVNRIQEGIYNDVIHTFPTVSR